MAARYRAYPAFSRAPCCLHFLSVGNLARTDDRPERDRTGTCLVVKPRDTFVELAHLQPRVTVNDRVYLEQTATVAELAVLARRDRGRTRDDAYLGRKQ